jgi:hypothetical protein
MSWIGLGSGPSWIIRSGPGWEFLDTSGAPVRLLFECRSKGRPINQQAMHSWRSVVDDVSQPDIRTIGVMVTTTGYQSGAQRVADTYGLMICELREPNAADLHNRVVKTSVTFVARVPKLTDLEVKATEQLGPHADFTGPLGEFILEFEDGSSERLGDQLLRGELAKIDEPPTVQHRATRSFDPPAVLSRIGEPIARVWQISATVWEAESEPTTFSTEMERAAWMIANTLTGSRVWFAENGNIWQTPN